MSQSYSHSQQVTAVQNMSACNVNMESHHSVWKGPQEMIQLPSHLVRYIKKKQLCRTASAVCSSNLPQADRCRFCILTVHRCTSRSSLNSPSLSGLCWRVRRKFCKPDNFWFSLLVFTAVAGLPYRSTNPKSCQANARKTKTTKSRNQTT